VPEEVTDASKLFVYTAEKTHEMVPDETLNWIAYERCVNCELTTWDAKIEVECPSYWQKLVRYGEQNTAGE
jgi:hypothetical protein